MFCTSCGKQSKDGEKFCTSCGKPFSSETPSEKPQSTTSTFSTSTPPIDRVKRGIPTGWKVVIGIGILVVLIAVIDSVGSGNDSSSASSDNNFTANQQYASQSIISLPTIPSQIPNYSGSQRPPSPGDAPVASSSETGSSFSSSDVAPYLTAVGEVMCDQNGQPYDSGSGSVWQFSGSSQAYVLTNYHVIQDDDSCTFLIIPTANDATGGYYDLDISSPVEWNNDTDAAVVPITSVDSSFTSSTPITDLNYSIPALSNCPVQMPQESPVAVLGFPASTQNSGPTLSVNNGNISGYDNSNPDAYNDYYVSAQVDNGNSGGIVLSKYNNAICILGIPTWVSVGEHQVEGDVQDINNIFYSNQ